MKEPANTSTLSQVLRSSCDEIGALVVPLDAWTPHLALIECAEARLFALGMIAPAAVVSRKALLSLAAMDGAAELTGTHLVEQWGAHLDARIHQFVEDPKEWPEPDVEDFFNRCAIVFGVEEPTVPALLSKFHVLPERQRFAIFVKLLNSPQFAYLLREIRAMPPGQDMDIDDPAESMRALMRAHAEGAC